MLNEQQLTTLKVNQAMVKIMEFIGTPSWFQGISSTKKDEGFEIWVKLNKIVGSQVLNPIPREVDGIKVRVIYQDPVSCLKGRW